jgi:hypothetical protein
MNNDNTQNPALSKTSVMPRFFCKRCNTHIGCSYYNFGVECKKELKFKKQLKNKKMKSIIEKIESRLKELNERKKSLEELRTFKLGKKLEIRIINVRIDELNKLLNE